jgi:hypothetical protein
MAAGKGQHVAAKLMTRAMKRSARSAHPGRIHHRGSRRGTAPSRAAPDDVARRLPFVAAVVPFEQIAIDFRDLTEASQRARFGDTLQRAGEDMHEGHQRQNPTQLSRAVLPAHIER